MRKGWTPRTSAEEVDELVAVTLRDMQKLGEAEGETVAEVPALVQLLRCAADLITESFREGQTVGCDYESVAALMDRARAEAAIGRLSMKRRLALQLAVTRAAIRCNGLLQLAAADAERRAAADSTVPASEWSDEAIVADWSKTEDTPAPVARAIAVQPALCRPGLVYEVRMGLGTEWREAVPSADGKRWARPDGSWLCYRSGVTEARIREDEVRDVVEALLQDRRDALAAGLTEKDAARRAEWLAGEFAAGYVTDRDSDTWLYIREDLLDLFRHKAKVAHCVVLVRQSDRRVITGATVKSATVRGSRSESLEAVAATTAAAGCVPLPIDSLDIRGLPEGEIWAAFRRPAGDWEQAEYGEINVTNAYVGLFHIPGLAPDDARKGPAEGLSAQAAPAADDHQEEIDKATAAVLRQYRYNASTISGASALAWADADIEREAAAIARGRRMRKAEARRVHTALRRRFNRYMVHVDDSQPLPDGPCEVWMKDSKDWVPACIERRGETWTLPIGRVSREIAEKSVLAVRPAA
ncbi:hypothetical protein [Tianweitania sediminis]|uniref:Uncharacterized protein n=1 Tax=Tianweitania sediminis TaxID=1502156 RepID=A0A8J7R512_9HYPH|nr:hypothetical protein [Tianweitania sediminis]MBP0439915.1 hypothetical protein [Tianweitania sediminis]